MNRSVACDLENRLIYGQPQTMPRQGEPLPIRSEIASYSLVNGDDLNWIRLPEDDFYAGGMTMLPGGRVLLGAQATLSIFDPAHAGLVAEADLSFVGIQDIGGLSYRPQTRTLMILDDADQRLHTVSIDDTGLDLAR